MWRTTGVAICLLLMMQGVAEAHTETELDEWNAEWFARADNTLSRGMLAEYRDMRERHPWYWQKPREDSGARSPTTSWTGGVEQWRDLVAVYFPASEIERALCVMSAESRGDPNADNPTSTAAGLFQFLRSTWDSVVPISVTGGSYASGQVYLPEPNVRAAAWLVAADGWHHWNPWKRGECR